jgi:hypothetical protein
VYKPLPPGVYPIAVDKYVNINTYNPKCYPGVGDTGLRQSCYGLKMMLSAKHGLMPQLREVWCFIIRPHAFVKFLVMNHRQATPLMRAKTKELLVVPTSESFNGPCFWLRLERGFSCRPLITHSSDESPKQITVSRY